MTAIQNLFAALIRFSRAPVAPMAPLAAGCAIGLVGLVALPPFALGQAATSEDRFDRLEDSRDPGSDILAPDFEAPDKATQQRLDWIENPGAFEQQLRRRISNPLFPPDRQVVQPDELKAAQIRDASDARSVLSDFVDLTLERPKLGRAKTVEQIELALTRYQSVLRGVMSVGGEVESLKEALFLSRTALIERWRVALEDNPEILAALDVMLAPEANDDPTTSNEFAAQLQREDGPIPVDELAPSLLTESPDSIAVVFATLSPELRSETRNEALNLILGLQSLGVRLKDEQAKMDLLLASDPIDDPTRDPTDKLADDLADG